MKWICFNEQISSVTVENFIKEVNESTGSIGVRITSSGGSIPDGLFLSDFINNECKIKEINFVWECSSAMFKLFLLNKKPFKVFNVFAVLHYATITISSSPNRTDRFIKKTMDNRNLEMLELYKEIGLGTEELSRISKKKDTEINQDEMLRLKRNYDKLYGNIKPELHIVKVSEELE